jgi:serine/threonine protein kinase
MAGPLLPQQSQQPQSPQQSQLQRETAPQLDALPELLRTAAAIAHALAFIADNGVVHYDLRCDNVLLVNDVPVLGDFGECHVFSSTSEQFESRGTECVKAPEMLLVSCGRGGGPLATGQATAPLEMCGTSSPCDVWALGCLVFELLTGSFLYDEALTSWPTFFTRITRHASDSLPLLPPDKSALLTRLYGEAAAKHVQEEVLLKLLVPNPDQRPSAALARSLLEAAAAALGAHDQ